MCSATSHHILLIGLTWNGAGQSDWGRSIQNQTTGCFSLSHFDPILTPITPSLATPIPPQSNHIIGDRPCAHKSVFSANQREKCSRSGHETKVALLARFIIVIVIQRFRFGWILIPLWERQLSRVFALYANFASLGLNGVTKLKKQNSKFHALNGRFFIQVGVVVNPCF
jgi:hypothetical protein